MRARFCGKCGGPLQDGAKFCDSCGWKIIQCEDTTPIQPQPGNYANYNYTMGSIAQSKKKNTGKIIGIIIASIMILAGIGIGVYLLFFSKDPKQPENNKSDYTISPSPSETSDLPKSSAVVSTDSPQTPAASEAPGEDENVKTEATVDMIYGEWAGTTVMDSIENIEEAIEAMAGTSAAVPPDQKELFVQRLTSMIGVESKATMSVESSGWSMEFNFPNDLEMELRDRDYKDANGEAQPFTLEEGRFHFESEEKDQTTNGTMKSALDGYVYEKNGVLMVAGHVEASMDFGGGEPMIIKFHFDFAPGEKGNGDTSEVTPSAAPSVKPSPAPSPTPSPKPSAKPTKQPAVKNKGVLSGTYAGNWWDNNTKTSVKIGATIKQNGKNMDIIIYDAKDKSYSFLESENNIGNYDPEKQSFYIKEEDALGTYEIGIMFYKTEAGNMAGEGWFVHGDGVSVKFYVEKQ